MRFSESCKFLSFEFLSFVVAVFKCLALGLRFQALGLV